MAAYAIRNIEGRTLAFDSYGYFEHKKILIFF